MLRHRTVQAVLVSPAHPTGLSLTPNPIESLRYTGTEIHLKLR